MPEPMKWNVLTVAPVLTEALQNQLQLILDNEPPDSELSILADSAGDIYMYFRHATATIIVTHVEDSDYETEVQMLDQWQKASADGQEPATHVFGGLPCSSAMYPDLAALFVQASAGLGAIGLGPKYYVVSISDYYDNEQGVQVVAGQLVQTDQYATIAEVQAAAVNNPLLANVPFHLDYILADNGLQIIQVLPW